MSQLENLKQITSLGEFAMLLGFKPSAVSYILYKIPNEDKYVEFTIPKKNGNLRSIKAPIEKLKKLQQRLNNILSYSYEEINKDHHQSKSLSHGFRKNHSIITNAKKHRNKRYVFNIDLQDFFPSINFGRVRGFFIKNNHFKLDPKIATIIAQIACHNDQLPQGSPCSPIISNFIGHLLDIRMVYLAKKAKCTYSRYADDLTFSTNKKYFPEIIAIETNENNWSIGKKLKKEIEKVGFTINENKVSMQYKTNRQVTTGLIINKIVNIKSEYYRKTRAMCHELFKTGQFYINNQIPSNTIENTDENKNKQNIGTINQLEGILSFIYQVKSPHYICDINGKRLKHSAFIELYRKFLFFKHFFLVEKPLIIVEGKTDIIYLKCALKQLKTEYTELITYNKKNKKINFEINFLRMSKTLTHVLDISTGTSGLKNLLIKYEQYRKYFPKIKLKFPIIIFRLLIFDNFVISNPL